MSNVTPLRPPLYEAKRFEANTGLGQFAASGTLCGHIDFTGPWQGSYPLSPDEAAALAVMLQQARADVLDNSDPLGDPRIVPAQERHITSDEARMFDKALMASVKIIDPGIRQDEH